MRLGDFRLERYGPFEQLDLSFDPAPNRINLVVAPNGFGKSVIRRSIGDFLFGIETRTPMTFRHGTERMRLRAEVIDNGTKRTLIRRKGNGNTLSIADGPELPADEAHRLRGGATETVFRELFGLDTMLLRTGGRELIHSQGRLGQVLFAAGGNLGRVRDLLTELERKRDELGKATARHKSRPIWNALSAWEQGRADLRHAAMRPDNWTTLERQAAETATHLQILLREQAADTSERDRLRTVSACRPWLDRLQQTQSILAESADTPDLDETFEKRWREALEARVKSASATIAAETELQAARAARADLRFDAAWIAAEPDIKALANLRGLAQGAENDLPRVQREMEVDRAKAAALRRDLGWSDTLSLAPAPTVKDAQRRLQAQPKLAAEAASAQNRLTDADAELAATLHDLQALPAQSNVQAVADLLALLRAPGDPALRLNTAQARLLQAEDALRTALSAIPDCALSEAALHTTAAPSEPRLEACDKALAQAEAARDRANQALATRLFAIDAERTRLAALEHAAKLPAPDALAHARTHRDAVWAQLCTPAPAYPEPAPPDLVQPGLSQRALAGSGMRWPDPAGMLALDRAIRDADAVADALIAHGRDVAEAAALRDRLTTMEADRAKEAKAVKDAEHAVAAAKADLLVIARAAGGAAADMPTLRAFLRARATAVSCRDARDAAAAELAQTERQLTVLSAGLSEALRVPSPDLPALGVLLAEADRRVAAAADIGARQKSLADQATRQRLARTTATTAQAKADRALADWTEQWTQVATALARPPAEAPATTADALARIEELRAVEQKAADWQRRVDDMQAAIALLTARVNRLGDLAPALVDRPPIEAADIFLHRLQTEQREAARCTDADHRIEQATAKLTLCANDAAAAERTLGGLRAALRAETDDEAERQLMRARAAAAARTEHAASQRELAIQGGGLTIAALAARAAETTADADTAKITAIEARQQMRAPLIDAARDAATAAATALDQAGSATEAADAAQRREAAGAMLARAAEEALILHATHALLQTALDRQAAGADQPLLNRISEVFRTITGSAYAGVRIEDAKDGQSMVAMEADGATRKPLDQLSEGTCDQLYLALRLAALEDYATTTSPLPFIADDVLQTFDDARTVATMQALLQLSHRVQVIILTHHPHVGDLAARLPQGTAQVMRLDAKG